MPDADAAARLADEAARTLRSNLGRELAAAYGMEEADEPITNDGLACRLIQMIEEARDSPAYWFPWAEVLTYALREGRYERLATESGPAPAQLLKRLGSELGSLSARVRSDDDMGAYGILAHSALQRATAELETLSIEEQRAVHHWALGIASELQIPQDILGWPPLHP